MHLRNNDLLDEELLLLQRYGKEDYGRALCFRYLSQKKGVGARAAPALMGILDEETYTFVFNHAFANAVSSYRFGKKSFISYFESVLRHELHHEVDAQFHQNYSPLLSISMEAEDPFKEGSKLCLHDIVGEEEEYDEVENFIRYLNGVLNAEKAPKGINKKSILLLEEIRKGNSLRESCKILSIPYSSGKIMMKRLKDFMETTYFHRDIVY